MSRAAHLALPLAALTAGLLTAAPAGARGCHERSEIVGKQRCSRFGARWDVNNDPAMVLSVGPALSRYTLPPSPLHGDVEMPNGREVPFTLDSRRMGRGVAAGPAFRLSYFPIRALYVGVEVDFATAIFTDTRIQPRFTSPALTSSTGSMLVQMSTSQAVGSVVGVSVPWRRLDFSLEMLAGFRVTHSSVDWTGTGPVLGPAACVKGPRGPICPWADSGALYAARVEPRGGLALRLTPWVTLRALVGYDPLGTGGVSGLALLESHFRSYDGFYTRRPGAVE